MAQLTAWNPRNTLLGFARILDARRRGSWRILGSSGEALLGIIIKHNALGLASLPTLSTASGKSRFRLTEGFREGREHTCVNTNPKLIATSIPWALMLASRPDATESEGTSDKTRRDRAFFPLLLVEQRPPISVYVPLLLLCCMQAVG